MQNSMNQADDVERVGISPDLALPPLFSMECHPTPIMNCDCLAVELNRTLSNTIEPNQHSIAPFFVRARLSSITEPNHMIEFDWVRLNLINRMFNLVRLVTSGKHKDLKL